MLKSKVLQFFLSAFLFLALSASGVANSVQLVLHERVDVTNSPIRLGDVVAQIEGRLEPKQLSALKAIKLKPAPLPGRASIEITSRALGVYLRVGRLVLKEVGLTPDQVKISPEAKVTVHRKSSSVTADQLKQFVTHQVTQTLIERFPAEYQVEVNRPIRNTEFPFGKVSFSLKPISAGLLAGSLYAYVDILVDGQKRKTVVVPLTVEMKAHIITAKHNIKRHQLISESMLAQQEKTITDLRRIPLKLSGLLGRRAKSRILKDSILAGDVVESMPKILNGNAVLITVQINGVNVRTTGKALADGRVGDKIKVVNQTSRKTIIGTVTEDGEIEVSPQR